MTYNREEEGFPEAHETLDEIFNRIEGGVNCVEFLVNLVIFSAKNTS